MEVWKPVVGYEGFYEVSDMGNVRSLTRSVPYGRWPGMVYRGRILKQRLIVGYPGVTLSSGGVRKNFYIHELILAAFVGPRPETEERGEIRHLDGVKTNSCLSNLVYGTIKENAEDHKFHAEFGNVPAL